ncbi:MAG: hypothetical protein SF052_15725 [Bacteroidia bacterium]|nr:hypothetical protein [Bacteroidia bacterium]
MFKKINITQKLTRAGGLVAGAAAASMINNKLVPMVMKNADAKISNLITFGIGLFAPDLLKKKGGKVGGDLIASVGDGIVAASGLNLVKVFAPNLVSGTGVGMLDYSEDYLSGYLSDNYRATVGSQYQEDPLAVVR